MIANIKYIEQKFGEFNQMMFKGKLHPIPIRLTKARTFLGQVKYMQKRNLFGKKRFSNFQFVFSTRTDLPESEVEDTIIHEMIHYWILSNQMQDTSAHGEIFRQKMQEINRQYGRHVTVSHRKTEEERGQDAEVRQHLVCVVRFKDGTSGITIAAKTRLFRLWDGLTKVDVVESCEWYSTLDPFFNRYPRALTLKVYPIAQTDLEEHLKGALRLVRSGNTVRVVR